MQCKRVKERRYRAHDAGQGYLGFFFLKPSFLLKPGSAPPSRGGGASYVVASPTPLPSGTPFEIMAQGAPTTTLVNYVAVFFRATR